MWTAPPWPSAMWFITVDSKHKYRKMYVFKKYRDEVIFMLSLY